MLQIENRKGSLKLNDGIHKESADKLIKELNQLYGPAAVLAHMKIGDVVCSASDALESVTVEINSPGGSVFEGQRIYSALREMSSRGVEVSTTVNGLAASMGSVILMAGDIRSMTKGSRIMIHEASTMAWGDARTMRRNADLLESISSEIAGIYAERTGGDLEALRALMLAETWMDANQAKELGFINQIISYDQSAAKAEFDTASKDSMSILAKLFPGNDEVAKFEAALAEADALRADLEAAQARVEELTPLAEANIALQAEINDLTAKLVDADKIAFQNEQTIADLQAKAEKIEDLASVKAAELLAAQGHPQPVALSAGDDKGTEEILAQFASMKPGPERTAFFNLHRNTLSIR